MRTVFIGGGKGCRDVLDLIQRGRLSVLNIEPIAVVDIEPNAPGIRFAREIGISTLDSISEALSLDGVELVVELTGTQSALEDIYRHLPQGVRVMDHALARVFWDLDAAVQRLGEELDHKTRLEAQLTEERARLQEILDTVPDMVMVLDEQMRIVRVNRRFEEETGVSRRMAQGMMCYEAICGIPGPDGCNDEQCPYLTVLKTGKPVNLIRNEPGLGCLDGYYQVTATPIFDDEGRIVRVVETSREITEQVLLKRETEESARRFEQILEAVHAIITIKDTAGRYQLVNPHAAEVLERAREEMLGRTDAELFPAEVAKLLSRNDQAALDGGKRVVQRMELHLDGADRVLVAETFPLYDYKGDRVGVCMVARDETRREELQKELLNSERLAAVGKLAAGVAHELNNPLTGILTFVEDLLLDADEDDPRREDYDVILHETIRCRRIVRDLLDYSRQKAPERRLMNINEVIERTVNMVAHQASFHHVRIDLRLEEDLPAVHIDPNQIQQAILNLVINARDAITESGIIRISSALDRDQGRVTVSVSDTGCGIPAERLKDIFKPFYSTKGDQGNGLGLPAVESVVSQHGGSVEVDSQVGEGSTFRFHLPVPSS